MYSYTYDSPVGKITLVEKGGKLTGLYFTETDIKSEQKETVLIKETFRQLELYFQGKLKVFELPLEPEGTEFRKSVWRELQKISYGETVTYGDIASRIGNPKAVRAVGGANHNNPISIIIPCHRVIGADGSLTGYGGGLANKTFLIALEKENC